MQSLHRAGETYSTVPLCEVNVNLVYISEAMLLSMQLHSAVASMAAFCSFVPHFS